MPRHGLKWMSTSRSVHRAKADISSAGRLGCLGHIRKMKWKLAALGGFALVLADFCHHLVPVLLLRHAFYADCLKRVKNARFSATRAWLHSELLGFKPELESGSASGFE
jgi:hypothetical protein